MKIIMAFLLFLSTMQAVQLDGFIEFGLGVDAGGDILGEISYEQMAPEEIRAGDGWGIGGGIRITPEKKSDFQDFSTELTVKMLYSSEDASNGDVSYSRFPVTLMEYYTFSNWTIGAGVSYHLNPSVSGDGFASNANMDLDSKLGKVFELGYLFSRNMSMGLEYADMEYSFHSHNIEANRVALLLKLGMSLMSQKQTAQEESTPVRTKAQLIKDYQYRKSYQEAREQQFGTTPVKDEDSDEWFGACIDMTSQGSSYTTSGDDDEDEERRGREYIPRYVSNNMDTLAIEIANGSGETLETLSSLLKVKDRDLFQAKLKAHFNTIYHDSDVSASDVYNAIVALK